MDEFNDKMENIDNQEFKQNEEMSSQVQTDENMTEENVSVQEMAEKENPTASKRTFLGKKDKQSKKIEALQAEIDKIKQEKADLQDKYLRLYSEFDNFRKRSQKEKLEIIKNASESMMVSILPIIDDMERAMKYNQNEDAELSSIVEGTSLILQKMLTLLKQKGLSVIETENKSFDTDYHEAVSIVPAQSEADKGKILDVVQKGYILNDKVIRFAKVVIYQ